MRSDDKWASDSVYSYPEMCFLPFADAGTEWEKALSLAITLVSTYLRSGSKRFVLRESEGVGVGFVDGDLTILWPESAA